MSNATKPIELQNAITAADEAWRLYDIAVEDKAPKDFKQQLWNVVNWMEERKGQMYTAWQNSGGTSDIDCVTFDATLHAEDLGTRMIISGGDMLELGAQTGSCEDIF